jgi:uncharacterized protein YqjF (DUF2071 family)
MSQRWHNLLFAHWPVPHDALRPLIPPNLCVDTFDGQAWLGIIAFRLSGIRLRGFPEIRLVSRFPEINVRTYVTLNGKPGVWFLSLDADNPLAIALARPWFHLPYFRAKIRFQTQGDTIRFSSRRTSSGAPPAEFEASYRPVSRVYHTRPGTLDHWLTERYCYYALAGGRLYCCDVRHPPWSLQTTHACITTNSMALAHGIELPPVEPLLHYAHRMQALIWPVRTMMRRARAGWKPALNLPLLHGDPGRSVRPNTPSQFSKHSLRRDGSS